MPKGWVVSIECVDEEIEEAVFADTKEEALRLAQKTESLSDYEIEELEVCRSEELDDIDRPNNYVFNWGDKYDRKELMNRGWHCTDVDLYWCEKCGLTDICEEYQEYMENQYEEDNK